MTTQNLDFLIVTDENLNLKGVVERERIVSRLLLEMAA